jgi:hypothetical protein
VAEWQQAGFTDIQSYLSPKNAWGTGNDGRIPFEEYEQDYADWVSALIERYDGDGFEDMQGLVAPLDLWVVGGEWSGFWPDDDADSYLPVLEVTRERILAANPQAHVGLIPINFTREFAGSSLSVEEAQANVDGWDKGEHNSPSEYEEILDHPELFDSISIHSLGDYTELANTMGWLQSEMAERGYSREVFVDDAFPMTSLANRFWDPIYPVTDDTVDRAMDLLHAAEDDPRGVEAQWIRAECAKGSVHKAVTALGEGYAGIMLGNTEDWFPDEGDIGRGAVVDLIGAATMMGIMEVVHADGLGLDRVREPGDPRPAFWALQQLAEHIGDGDFETMEPIGIPGLRGYRFEREGQELLVVWQEDDVLQFPGDEEPKGAYTLPVSSAQVDVAWTVTQDGQSEAVTESYSAVDGFITIELDGVPVFVTSQ